MKCARVSPSRFAVVAVIALAACGVQRPARFVDSPTVTRLVDVPIPLPRRREPIEAIYLSQAYVERPVVDALDFSRTPDARDINALDEVPRSSFFDPEARSASDGPPKPPLAVLPGPSESGMEGLRVSDARGIRYELLRDPAHRPEMRTAAIMVGSRLMAELGYFVPETHLVEFAPSELVPSSKEAKEKSLAPFLSDLALPESGKIRVAAVRWPVGIDRGPTPSRGRRTDDPNDVIEHEDRRTLRALGAFFFWIGAHDLFPGVLRDSYLGKPGLGHLQHWLVGLDGALGADAARAPRVDIYDADPNIALLSLGLVRREPPPVQTRWLSLGRFDKEAQFERFSLRPPFAPSLRALPGDRYWAAKRLLSLSERDIDAALEKAGFSDPGSRARAKEVLDARRQQLILHAFAEVTPCELDAIDSRQIVLRDEAIAHGF